MSKERKLTPLGKIVVFLFIAGCFYGAWHLLSQGGKTSPPMEQAQQTSAPSPVPAPAAAKPAAATPEPGSATPPRTNTLDDIRQRQVLRIAYEGDAPPMYYVAGQGPPTRGFEYDLARRLAGELGIPRVAFVAGDYADLPGLLRTGQADLLLAGYIPDPAIDGVEWSDGYLDFGLCLIVLKSSAVTEPEHLAGKTVAVYDDPAAIRWVGENIPNAKVLTFSGESGWFEALETRQADGLVYDYPFAAVEIADHPRTQIVKFNLNRTRYAVGLPAGNDRLLDAVNGALKQIMATPAYADLVRQYMPFRSDSLTRPVAGAKRTYTVKEGDTLGRIAARVLGSGERWTEIWELNRGRIPNPHLIFPQYVLILP